MRDLLRHVERLTSSWIMGLLGSRIPSIHLLKLKCLFLTWPESFRGFLWSYGTVI